MDKSHITNDVEHMNMNQDDMKDIMSQKEILQFDSI